MFQRWIVVAAIVAIVAMPAVGQVPVDPSRWMIDATNVPQASTDAARKIDVSSLTATWHVTAAEPVDVSYLLIRRKLLASVAQPAHGSTRDVSSDGRLALITGYGPPRGGNRYIAIALIENPNQPAVIRRFQAPHGIVWAAFIDHDHLLGYDGQYLTLWRWRDTTAIYVVQLGPKDQPEIDHDRRHVTWYVNEPYGAKQAVVLDALSGEIKGVIDHAVRKGRVRVSPDGTRVALNRNGHLTVLQGADGKVVAHIVYRPRVGDECWWLDNRFILTGGGYLLDTFTGIVAWRFDRPYSQDVLLLQSQKALTDARAAIDTMVEDEVFAVRPGVAVSLDVSVQGGPDAARRISAAITQRLADQGVMVAQDQPVTLVATWKRGRWRVGFGDSLMGRALAFVMAPQRIKLAFVQNGVTLWSREQLIDELASPDFSLLEQSPLPRFVAKAEYLDGLGQTQPTLDDK